jgi:uncharacterized protein (TIGR00297 family)
MKVHAGTHRHSEAARQGVHIAMGLWALLLRYLAWWQAAILAGVALAFNWYVLPRVGGARLYRSVHETRRLQAGIVVYPLSVGLLILVFHDRLDIAAAAWAVLAAGDGMATLVGRAVGGPRIPWNEEKTISGTAAFWIFGSLAGSALALWCRQVVMPPPYLWFSVAAPVAAAGAAALVETIPVRLDDNISVPASAGAVLWALSLVSASGLAALGLQAAEAAPVALLLNGLVASAGYLARTVSVSGAIGGALIGATIFIAAGWRGWVLLMAAFLAASISSRMGVHKKTLLGIAEAHGGRRGVANAVANTGVAAAAAVMATTTYAEAPAMLAFVAALTAGGSDTVASEIGKAWGGRTWSVVTFRRVPAGTAGAVSLEGTAAGLGAAAVLALLAAALGLIPIHRAAPVIAAATLSSFVESALGATLEAPGVLNNDMLNFLNTACAAWLAIAIAGMM